MATKRVLTAFLLATVTVYPVSGVASAFAQTVNQQREQEITERNNTLQTMIEERQLTLERARKLQAEIDAIKKDRASITNALIQAAKTEKQLANAIIDLEGKILDLSNQSDGLRASLMQRRALLAEVLAGLQRMGLNPPPAMLVRPEDALSSVRSSILLAAVVPEMREQTTILLDDLAQLSNIRKSLETERARLDTTRLSQRDEQARLQLLIEERRALEGRTADRLAQEQRRAAELAAGAQSLQTLIDRLQQEMQAEREAARLAAEAAERERQQAQAEAERARQLARQAREAEERREAELAAQAAEQRLAALRRAEEAERQRPVLRNTRPFSELTRSLPLPVAGRMITAFGDDDGLESVANGETIQTRVGAIVTTPVDSSVLYAGPFRAYGQLLILDAGDGYQIVMAGMSSLDVSAGDRLLAGEPVGRMGNVQLASVSAAAIQNDNPTLYIEFRKNAKPIDPSPWWERQATGRT